MERRRQAERARGVAAHVERVLRRAVPERTGIDLRFVDKGTPNLVSSDKKGAISSVPMVVDSRLRSRPPQVSTASPPNSKRLLETLPQVRGAAADAGGKGARREQAALCVEVRSLRESVLHVERELFVPFF